MKDKKKKLNPAAEEAIIAFNKLMESIAVERIKGFNGMDKAKLVSHKDMFK